MKTLALIKLVLWHRRTESSAADGHCCGRTLGNLFTPFRLFSAVTFYLYLVLLTFSLVLRKLSAVNSKCRSIQHWCHLDTTSVTDTDTKLIQIPEMT